MLIPPWAPNAVVALGSTQVQPAPGQTPIPWVTEGTGFIYGYLTENDPDAAKRRYEVYLVTNRHVIEGHSSAQGSGASPVISVRLNPVDSAAPARPFDLPIGNQTGQNPWFFHSDKKVDIAAIRINPQALKEQALHETFFTNDESAANRAKLKDVGVSVGDSVFVLGFPALNLVDAPRNYVIARQGCIARISDMLDGVSPEYLIDASIFPGNSGGPVLLKPEMVSIQGTAAQSKAYLIGIVKAWVPYQDVAVSVQTKQARVIFAENSGLGVVLPTDYIDETIKAWREANPGR